MLSSYDVSCQIYLNSLGIGNFLARLYHEQQSRVVRSPFPAQNLVLRIWLAFKACYNPQGACQVQK